MDSSRRSSSRRDTTARSLRDSSNRSRSFDVTRHSAGQGGSTSEDYRAYTTSDAAVVSGRDYLESLSKSQRQAYRNFVNVGNMLRRHQGEYNITAKASAKYPEGHQIKLEYDRIQSKHRESLSVYKQAYSIYDVESSKLLGEEILSYNQQDDMGVSEYTRPHYSELQPNNDASSSRPTKGELRLTESDMKKREEQEEEMRRQYENMGLDYDIHKRL